MFDRILNTPKNAPFYVDPFPLLCNRCCRIFGSFGEHFNERVWLFHDGGIYHIKTSPLTCSANRWTGFYMIGTSVMKELRHWLETFIVLWTLILAFWIVPHILININSFSLSYKYLYQISHTVEVKFGECWIFLIKFILRTFFSISQFFSKILG